MNPIHVEYLQVKRACTVDWKGVETGDSILRLAQIALKFLTSECDMITLQSRVPEKRYFTFGRERVVARPANEDFFIKSPRTIGTLWKAWRRGAIDSTAFAKLSYTVALAPCLAMEMFDRQNRKGPATYFECFIGHLFSRAMGINPTTHVHLPIGGREVRMTMDFLFDVGSNCRKVHLPVKMSTRERIVQAWAHQRLLDAAYGDNQYRGIMVVFSETKLDSRNHEVIEICVPDQWLAYQSLLARMDRIYYFDMPARYKLLTSSFAELISIKQFGEFFTEKEIVLRS